MLRELVQVDSDYTIRLGELFHPQLAMQKSSRRERKRVRMKEKFFGNSLTHTLHSLNQ